VSELRAVAARPIYIEAVLARDGVAVDTTAASFKVWFTLKLSKDDLDADAVAAKTEAAGIAVNTPVTVSKNVVTVTLAAADTDEFVESSNLYWDLVVNDPASGRGAETIDSGVLKLTAPVTRVVS